MEADGKEYELRIHPFGLHPQANEKAIAASKNSIKGYIGSIDGKSSTFLSADQILGNK